MSNGERISRLTRVYDALDQLIIVSASSNNLINIKAQIAAVINDIQGEENKKSEIIAAAKERSKKEAEQKAIDEMTERAVAEALSKAATPSLNGTGDMEGAAHVS